MREHISRQKKTTTGFSIPSLKHPTPGFGLESSAISRQAVPEIQPLHQPVTHDISRIPLRSPQAKLSISQPGDIYEQEADSVAQQVMQRMAQPVNRQPIQREILSEEEELQMKPLASSITPLVQREALLEDEEEELQMKPVDNSTLQREALPEDEEELQMKSLDSSTLQREALPEDEEELQMKPMVQRQAEAGMAAAPDLEASISQARGGGQAIADNIREPMEQAFGADFSGVKVHTDGKSDQLNQSIQARAFTTGQDVFFRQGEYNPGSRGGQELLAHELTHVVQQNNNTVNRQLIQRAVGFEFEFGEWKSYKNDDKKSRLAKGEEIISGTGYKIEGEDTYDSKVSAVEVVTKPYTTRKEALESVTEAQEKMQSMSKDGEDIGHLANKYGGKASVFIEPHGKAGKVQASAAIPLDKLANLYSIQAGGDGKGLGASVTTKLQNEDLKNKYLDGKDASPELIGLVTLVLDYIEQGSGKGNLSYPKSTFKLMARTSFDKMLTLVPEHSFFSNKSNIDKWAGLVLEIAASLGMSKKQEVVESKKSVMTDVEVKKERKFKWMTRIFGKRKVTEKVMKEFIMKQPTFVKKTAEELAEEPIINQVLMGMELLPEDSDKDKQSYKLKIKRIEWLKGMLKEDLISKATDKRFEGMGSYGVSTDVQVIPEDIEVVTEKAVSKAVDELENEDEAQSKSVSKETKEAPIFELRGMKDMFAIQQDINLTDWTEKVKAVFEVIEEANKGESFAPGGKPNIPKDVDKPDIWEKV
ncbi:DUF4157 domain-containing protein [Nostoc punctiforme]|uniref:eCIS core domain-containing protein n=1 Tax=Nostoc punctiforme (strain ATCC 29133 / PCC 73102) TaxID=63737 RepID=B2IW84_NOSP7|nr:DUF4157 domain-containing protein [Nostoc punctiforme]ACC79829.1 hypothetical protein Npun_F1103 [Nostoc punctiforme PCC 73102]